MLLYLLEKRMAQEGAGTWSAEKGEERPASPCAPDFQNPAAYTSPSSAPLLPPSVQPAKQPELHSLASLQTLRPTPLAVGAWTPPRNPDPYRTDAPSQTLNHLLPGKPNPSPAEIPDIRVALKALLHKVVEVGGEGAVVGVG